MSSSIGVFLGVLGLKYWSLIWMLVSTNVFLAIGFWIGTGWLPNSHNRGSGVRNLIKFGTDVASLNAFSTLAKNIDKVILGKFVGLHDLGIYNRAFLVTNLISA